jgi:glycerate 2-kinase
LISNRSELAKTHGKSAQIVLSALEHAIQQVDPAVLVQRAVSFDGELKIRGIRGERIDLRKIEDAYVVGAGKGCARMAKALHTILGNRITAGAINIPYEEKETFGRNFRSLIRVTQAAHPVPDSSGVKGSMRIIDVLAKVTRKDLVFVLISGGGSALLPLPPQGISLEDKQAMTNRLLHSGASIQEVNTVRKHLSAIKGGQLVRHTNGATVVSLILSDVVGDDMSAIASAPTHPDSSTFADALAIVKKYKVAGRTDSTLNYLIRGAKGLIHDTPKRGDTIFRRVHNILIGNNEVACAAAVEYFCGQGIKTAYLGSRFEGEAAVFGSFLGQLASDIRRLVPGQFAAVLGGETTVKIEAVHGIGGRNQEAALSCAATLPPSTVVACMCTDGIDGNSHAAGSLVSESTRIIARQKRIDLKGYLRRHDSYHALKKTSSLIFTGRTGTNVNDIAVIFSAG